MCYIGYIEKLKKDPETLLKAINAIPYENHTHGYGVLMGDSEHNILAKRRTLSQHGLVKDLSRFYEEDGLEFMMAHCRTASSGSVSLKNVHFWEMNGWRFAHNGFVWDYHESLKDGKMPHSDSLLFLYEFIYKVGRKNKARKIINLFYKLAEKRNLSGRAILIDPLKRIYLFGDWEFYLLNESILMVSSETLSFDEKVGFGDIQFDRDGVHIEHESADGAYLLSHTHGVPSFKKMRDDSIDGRPFGYFGTQTKWPNESAEEDNEKKDARGLSGFTQREVEEAVKGYTPVKG